MLTEDRSPALLATGVGFLALAWICFLLRVYVRGYLLKTFGWDDWLIGASIVCFTVYWVCQVGGIIYGTGKHIWDLEPPRAQTALTFWWLCELFYIPTTILMKMSVGVFLHRIAIKKIHHWTITFTMLSTALFGAVYFFAAIFQCKPVHAWWIRKHAPSDPVAGGYGWCFGNDIVVGSTFASAALNSVADWTFGLIPIFIVKDLQMPVKQKRLVAAILSFANIACVATIVRMPYIPNLARDDDFLYESIDIAIWSNVEPGVGIAAACIATLRPLLQSFLGNRGGWWSGRGETPQRHYPSGKKLGSSGQSYTLKESLPTLRPDYVGNYTQITAGNAEERKRERRDSDKDKDDVTITGVELRDMYDLAEQPKAYERRISFELFEPLATAAAPTKPGISEPAAAASTTTAPRPSQYEIQKSVEFTFTEEIGREADEGPRRGTRRLGLSKVPSLRARDDFERHIHFGPQPEVSYSNNYTYPRSMGSRARSKSYERSNSGREAGAFAPRRSEQGGGRPGLDPRQRSSPAAVGDPFGAWR